MATEKTPLLNNFVVISLPTSIDGLSEADKSKGLSLEELMPFESDPWWKNLRKTFFISFWATVFVIFAAACITSILQHGSCPAPRISGGSGRSGSTLGSKSGVVIAAQAIPAIIRTAIQEGDVEATLRKGVNQTLQMIQQNFTS